MRPGSAGEFQPGAARYGNFINYYTFNSADERVSLLRQRLAEIARDHATANRPLVCFDVGCNAGQNLTTALFRCVEENAISARFLAVDLDEQLIARAIEANPFPSSVVYERVDVMDQEQLGHVVDAFLAGRGGARFDVTFCLAITMWIHLNHGDDGLKRFLKAVSDRTEYLVLEPQPWKCYRAAARRMRRLNCRHFPEMDNLTMKANVVEAIDAYLVHQCDMKNLGATDDTQWGRKMIIYKHT